MPPTPSRAAKGVPADAIGVDVGIQHGDDLQPLIFDPAEVFIDMAQRIDDDRLTPGSDDVAEAPGGRIACRIISSSSSGIIPPCFHSAPQVDRTAFRTVQTFGDEGRSPAICTAAIVRPFGSRSGRFFWGRGDPLAESSSPSCSNRSKCGP